MGRCVRTTGSIDAGDGDHLKKSSVLLRMWPNSNRPPMVGSVIGVLQRGFQNPPCPPTGWLTFGQGGKLGKVTKERPHERGGEVVTAPNTPAKAVLRNIFK